MPSSCRCVPAASMTQVRALLVATSSDVQGCSAVLPLAGRCSLDFWLDAVKGSRAGTDVLVVGPSTHQKQLTAWAAAASLPSSCLVISNQEALDVVQGLAAAVTACPSLQDCYILMADASYVCEPATSLARLVEAAVVRGKDTVTTVTPFQGADLAQHTQVVVEDSATSSSRVRNIHQAAEGEADGSLDMILGPVCVIHPGSVHSIIASEADHQPVLCNGRALGQCMQQLLPHRAIYSVSLPFYFSLTTAEDWALTNAFFKYYIGLQAAAVREVRQLSAVVKGTAVSETERAATLDNLVERLQALGAGQPPSLSRQQLLTSISSPAGSFSTCAASAAGSLTASLGAASTIREACTHKGRNSSLKHMFAAFYDIYKEQGMQTPDSTDKTLPTRFEHPERWQLGAKQQHPCYLTSNKTYGSKQPTTFDMPLAYNGISGKFTNTFHGGCYRSMGLKTSVERSRVHRELDSL